MLVFAVSKSTQQRPIKKKNIKAKNLKAGRTADMQSKIFLCFIHLHLGYFFPPLSYLGRTKACELASLSARSLGGKDALLAHMRPLSVKRGVLCQYTSQTRPMACAIKKKKKKKKF